MKAFPATDYVIFFVFAVSVLAVVAGGLIAVASSRIIRSVCGLAICCLGLAGIYYFLHSPFLALMEILIYVGAICVTIIFAVMLAEPDEAPERAESRRGGLLWGGAALVVSGAIFWALTRVGLSHLWAVPAGRVNEGTLQDLGKSLLTNFSLAFEAISLVLLVAILGALIVARYGRTRQ